MNSTASETRGPGRPRKEEAQAERRRKRTERASSIKYLLQIPAEKLELHKFIYRWMSDDEARIFSVTKNDDWSLVHQDGTEIKDDADFGSAVNKVGGKRKDGSPLRQYLMRKPRKYWDEDQRQREDEIEKMFEEMRRGNDPDGSRAAGTYALDGNKL